MEELDGRDSLFAEKLEPFPSFSMDLFLSEVNKRFFFL
jgi:hypothetical protein